MSSIPTTRSQKRKSDNLTDQGAGASKKLKPDGFISAATLKRTVEETPDGEGDCVYVRRPPKVDLTTHYKKGPPRGKPPIKQPNAANAKPPKTVRYADSEVIALDSPPKNPNNNIMSASQAKVAVNLKASDGDEEALIGNEQMRMHTRSALHLKHMPFFSTNATFSSRRSDADRQRDDPLPSVTRSRHRDYDKVVAPADDNLQYRPAPLNPVYSQKDRGATEGLRVVIPQSTAPLPQPTTTHEGGVYRISGSPISDNESDQEQEVSAKRSGTAVVGGDVAAKQSESGVVQTYPIATSKKTTAAPRHLHLKIAPSATDTGRDVLANDNLSSNMVEGSGFQSAPISNSKEHEPILPDTSRKVVSATTDIRKHAVENASVSSSVVGGSQVTEMALSQSTSTVDDREHPVVASNTISIKSTSGDRSPLQVTRPGSIPAESREDGLVGTQHIQSEVGMSTRDPVTADPNKSTADQENVAINATKPPESKEVDPVVRAAHHLQSPEEFPAQSSESLLDTRYKIREEAFKCFLGYGIASLATDDDLGRGPLMKPQTRNVRTNNAGGQKAFRQAIQFDPRFPDKEPAQLARYLPCNAVEVAVSGGAVVLSSLTKNPHTSLFPHIQWANDPTVRLNADAERFQGATRAEYVRDWASSALRQLDIVDRQLSSLASSSSTNSPKLKQFINERKKLKETILERTSWLFAVYDFDMINANPLAHDILLFLSLNKPSYQRPDSEVAAMRITITHLLSYPKEQLEAKLKSDTLDPSVTFHNSNRRLASIFKDNPLFLSLVDFHRYSLLWPWKVFTPTNLDALRPVASPFVEVILQQATVMLNFLSSAYPLDRFVGDGLTIKEDATTPIDLESLREHLHHNPPRPVADFFDLEYVEIVNSCYKEELHPHHKLFGTTRLFGSTDYYTYQGATQRYNQKLPVKLTPWLNSRQIFAKAFGESELHEALEGFPVRLDLVSRGLFNSELFGMCLSTPSPIPCPLFYADAIDGLAVTKPYLQAAFTWIDAFVTDKNAINHNRGLTLALKDAIHSLKPTTSEAITLNLILGEIYSMRNIALTAMKNGDARVESPYPLHATPTQLLKIPQWNNLHSQIVALIKEWYGRASANHADIQKLDEMDLSPILLKTVLDDKHGRALINALTKTTFPWWHVGPAKVSYRLKAASKRALAAVASAAYQDEVYADVESYWLLRERISVILDNNTSSFQAIWDGLTSPYPELTPSQPVSLTGIPYSGRLALEAKAASIRQHTQKAIEEIALAVCDEYNGAIPVSVDNDHAVFRPHHDVHQAAVGLIRALAIASHQAQQTYLDPSSETRMRICGPDSINEVFKSFRLPPQFSPASFGDIVDFYASHNRKSAMELQTLGFGLRGQQRRNEARLQNGAEATSPFSTPHRRRPFSFALPAGSQASTRGFSIPIASSPLLQGSAPIQQDGVDGLNDDIIEDDDEDDNHMEEDEIEDSGTPRRAGLDSDMEEVPDSQPSYTFPPLNQLATQSHITPSVQTSLPVPPPAPRRLSTTRLAMSLPSSSQASRDSFGAPILSQDRLQLADLHRDEEEIVD